MKKVVLAVFTMTLLFSCATKNQSSSATHPPSDASKVQILMLGSLHFNQFYNKDIPNKNFFSDRRQQEIAEVNQLLKEFNPDMIMVEVSPEHQAELDSLYDLFRKDTSILEKLEDGSSEIYQFGFKLAKELDHEQLYAINYYNSTSQSLLAAGQNFKTFQNGLENFQKYSRGVTTDFTDGKTTFRDFLITLNKPETIELSHYQFYNLPAYVQNGSFRSYKGLNKNALDTTQIGAEFISLFYNRNLKIYSNILNSQLRNHGKRILLIMGQTHIGVLQDITDNNPGFEVINANTYLNKPAAL
ncbi:DUF5694 domain-containing protein [Pontibacter silvestris]|uniref:DUF5694 domain-containing protein n=1 Tax=Pontibacter silvestris TaxID=2305183 RepID=A0ABW4WTK4_9BACT|nr:DUF5694 domain-containing protein [Pontibacter silvestris]MCC9136281.1 DUF5694 domain-containing protein [Pontibacter silvestris]